jgi:hypothetical protein
VVDRQFIAAMAFGLVLLAGGANADLQSEPMPVLPVSPAWISSPFRPRVLAKHPQAGNFSDYVIRFHGNIGVTDAAGQSKPATEWVGKAGRARKLRDARVTAKGQQVGAVVCVRAKGMKEPWCLATSQREATAATLVNHYARRWTIEPQFRDTKDLQFGMGLSSTRIGEPMHRDRLLLVSAFATALLTLLGAVGESLGMDRLLKSNTSKTRTQFAVSPRLHALRSHSEHA